MTLYKRGKSDFPWWFPHRNPDTKFGAGANSYDLITDDDAIKYWAPWINSIFHPTQAVCFFWITTAKWDFCTEFIKACGFHISSGGLAWVKTCKNDPDKIKTGTGNYTAPSIELCPLATRDGFLPHKKLVPQVYEEVIDSADFDVIKHPLIYGPDGKPIHSRKPDIFRQRIDLMYPAWMFGKGIGLFEREPQGEDWDVFGNEVVSDIQGPRYDPIKKTFETAPGVQLKLI